MAGFPQFPREIVVYDLEFTAWQGSMTRRWMAPGEYREVVQIGAVRLDRGTLAEHAFLAVLVRPRVNPILSSYFETLTGITNAMLTGRGIDFPAAYDAFLDFAAGAPCFSFGRDDRIFAENFRLYGATPARPAPAFLNVAPWLIDNGLDIRGAHACDVARLAGAPFEGRDHDALDDARSVAAGMRVLLERGASPLLSQAPEMH